MKTVRCAYCGFDDRRGIEWAHLPGYEKKAAVGHLITVGATMRRIIEELNRCLPLCATHHKILDWNLRGRTEYRESLIR